ncbi:hypothetical protein ACKI2N_028185 [Cupriavidus sp. 30B13]|uniref:hypothetical protein n=1 Tax=Cupriavidus sp. 30B13 TaxID=3384241 RepID=UPI003B908D7A
MNEDDSRRDAGAARWVALAAVGGLDAAARLTWAGLVLALINVLLAGTLSPAGTVYLVLGIVAALAGALQLWLLVRVTIDRPLFAALAAAEPAPGAPLEALDHALRQLGWLRGEKRGEKPDEKQAKAGRSLVQRARGALRFLHWAAALAALQLLAALLLLLLR